jgi:aspartate-semialdehyde dehydrogenase
VGEKKTLSQKIPVAVLAATGTVGQRFVSLLENHPWFEVVVVTASERSAGKRYADAVSWVIPGEIPQSVADLVVEQTDNPVEAIGDKAKLVFSALPSDAAREVEPSLPAAGYVLASNASALRMEPDIPLLIPDINADHLSVIADQQAGRGWPGLVVTSPNCAVSSFVFPLKALDDAFGVTQAHVVTMQAISGAGYPGVASFDILDNVIPFIKGEEPKVEAEPRKILGSVQNGQIVSAAFPVSAQVNRVPVMDGHLAAMSFGLKSKASLDDVKAAIASYKAPDSVRALPSAPDPLIIVREEEDRPQPRRDRDAQNGMAISVGRIQPCAVMDYKLVVLVHNTLRGAAGGAILNAELLAAEGYLGEKPPL